MIDEVAVVGLALGDFVVDGGEHQLLHVLALLAAVFGQSQRPAEFDVGALRQHVVGGDDAARHHVAAGVIDEHVGVAPDGLHAHVLVYARVGGPLDGVEHVLVDMAQAGAVPHDALVAVVDQGVQHVGFHAGIVVEDGHAVVERRHDAGDVRVVEGQTALVILVVGDDLDLAVLLAVATVVIDLLDGLHAVLAVHGGQRCVADGAERGTVGAVHLPHTGAAVQEAVVVAGGAEHADHHLGDVTVTCSRHGVHEVQRRVGTRTVGASLRADQHHRHGQWTQLYSMETCLTAGLAQERTTGNL